MTATGEAVGRCGTALADLVRDGDRILIGTGASEPHTLLAELLAVAAERTSLELIQVQTGSRAAIQGAADAGHRVVLPVPGHGSPAEVGEILPSSMLQLSRAISSGALRIDGLLFSGMPVGQGALAPALCVDLVPAAFERARFRAVELNRGLPRVATELSLPRSRCELVVDSDHEPEVLPRRAADERATAIGDHVAELVHDGDVLELGIGPALAGVADALVSRGRRVAVHTGLVSDWAQTMVEGGVAERPLPCVGGRPIAGAVAMGSSEFYRWVDGSPSVLLLASDHAHDPCHLAGTGNFVAINAASRVDCAGQVGVAGDIADRRAVGGLLDFALAGAYGGSSIIAMESVDRRGRSRIVPSLTAVQLTSTLVTHVVTEHGVAQLANRTWAERRDQMIAVAHPDHRSDLRQVFDRPQTSARQQPDPTPHERQQR